MAGPMPPAIGGMVSIVRDLCESKLGESFIIETFNTSKQTQAGRTLRTAVATRLSMWRNWWRLIGAGAPVIAHIHTCSGLSYFLDAALLWIARVRGVPVVLHIHGGRFDGFIDQLDPLRVWFVRVSARSAERVIVLSESWRGRLEPLLPGARLRVIENAVLVQPLAAAVTEQRDPLILFLGALCREKGVEDLVRAFARLSHPAQLALVGPETETGFVTRMQVLASELGARDRIELPGPAQGAVKALWLARASIFVLPSYAEGQPISVLEAMAAGLPVVASAVGAIPTMIEPERAGLLIEAGDVDALSRALDRLLGDPGLREQLGRHGRAQCELRYSIDRAVGQLRTLYTEIVATPDVGTA